MKSVISHKSEATENSDGAGKSQEKRRSEISISVSAISESEREPGKPEIMKRPRESISPEGSDGSKEPQAVEATEEEKERQREGFGDTLARQEEEADRTPKIFDEATLSNKEEKIEKEREAEREVERERENDKAQKRRAKNENKKRREKEAKKREDLIEEREEQERRETEERKTREEEEEEEGKNDSTDNDEDEDGEITQLSKKKRTDIHGQDSQKGEMAPSLIVGKPRRDFAV